MTLLPAAAFVAQVFLGRLLPRKGDWVPTAAVGVGLGLSLWLFFTRTVAHPHQAPDWHTVYGLLSVGRPGTGGLTGVPLGFTLLVDNLTIVMLVVVTLVSFLVHVFSIGYMHGDAKYVRFFAFLGLFTFSMLGLVIAGNLLLLFIFWELVGVCSYFLIGHYYEKKSAQAACLKAFLTTRVGDLGFFLGIMMIFAHVGSLDFPDIFRSALGDGKNPADGWTRGGLAVAAIGVWLGAVGKSAQFPLHVWLPDAMEGPTPVSALIHAATMVAAGVYLVARMFPFFAGPEFLAGNPFDSTALLVVAVVGGFTALFAATIAVVQTDIKKVLAYSTVSQLGYMMVGLGCGSVAWGMFHLWSHAFFKALLFLGSGSVIHSVGSQEMSDMGGLRKKMPITFATMGIGTLAISGVPLLSGFVTKDGILAQALAYGMHRGGVVAILPFAFAIVAAALTAFYMFRMLILTFFGEYRGPAAAPALAHAAPAAPPPAGSGGGQSPLHHRPASDEGGHAAAGGPIPPTHHGGPLDAGHGAGGHGPSAGSGHGGGHGEPHESPLVMTLPLMILAFLAVISAGVGAVLFSLKTDWFEHRVNDTLVGAAVAQIHAPYPAALTIRVSEHAEHFKHAEHTAHTVAMVSSLAVAGLGIFLAWLIFAGPLKGRDLVRAIPGLAAYKKVLVNLYYMDWFYARFVVGTVMVLRLILRFFDKWVIDGLVNLAGFLAERISWVSGRWDYHGVDGAVRGTAATIVAVGGEVRRVQSGKIGDYVWGTVLGLAVLVFAVVLIGTGL
ncbi:MAG: NADH-quinone oxidoreductase subunit L [Planctomycetales bacterium]|nr:NADH-quinone oxidoreductase subunit L [Planctomycetales bacterium]